MAEDLKLYTYWRSSAAYRVRIALNLKGLNVEAVPISLIEDGGAQHKESYLKVNPHGLVPALEVDGKVISNSLAILEYLEEAHPAVPLLPDDALGRARVRQIALAIAADIHPLQNLRVLQKVSTGAEDVVGVMSSWARHWIEVGFEGLERQLQTDSETGQFCHGDSPTMADCCLIPQVTNALRYGVDMGSFPRIAEIDSRARELPAFASAAPENQPDATV